MTKYKRGDRVAVYGYTKRLDCDMPLPFIDDPWVQLSAFRNGEKGRVVFVNWDTLFVRFGKGKGLSECEVSPRQCRKLVKRHVNKK